GVVIAFDPNDKHAVIAYIQLAIDRTKASACLEGMLKQLARKGDAVTVKQDGAYTVGTVGTGKQDTAYFPWVAPNVVVISSEPEKKDEVDKWWRQKTFAKSSVAPLLGKLDPKALVAGAFVSDKPDKGL